MNRVAFNITIFIVLSACITLALNFYHRQQIKMLMAEYSINKDSTSLEKALKLSNHVIYSKKAGFTDTFEGQLIHADSIYYIESKYLGSFYHCDVTINNGKTDGHICYFSGLL